MRRPARQGSPTLTRRRESTRTSNFWPSLEVWERPGVRCRSFGNSSRYELYARPGYRRSPDISGYPAAGLPCIGQIDRVEQLRGLRRQSRLSPCPSVALVLRPGSNFSGVGCHPGDIVLATTDGKITRCPTVEGCERSIACSARFPAHSVCSACRASARILVC